MKKILSTGLMALGLSSALLAAPISFDFKDPKGVNAASFHLDALLEPISGSANGVTGTVSFDPSAPGSTTGKIVVAANTLTVTNSTMTEHLRGGQWLDVAANPEISFELASLANVKTSGNTTTADATGKFTLHGVTKDITVPVTLTFLPDALEKRTKPGNKGDILVVRTKFTIKRADYGIKPGQMEDKVSPEIEISLAIAGSAPKA
ncbi:hypothetical protein CMV30_03550 [Nibricoccus aquaticus]|uniref:Lipid/polyisoprenoid-binding YceI-like domain-containing protein n=1 Tax=Nibricoccus aquaticus TaxID=2576891 RepID=A0A290Q3L4_9BACT|nr:YceI family protein [Nibricoccus aquaticus]ATC63104.1 hypothetical protein CMV30_03550 [Nibricoccus aquaticus]